MEVRIKALTGWTKGFPPIYNRVKILFRIACSCLSRLTEGSISARAMCPDAVYLISSESISKEYRPTHHVYSLGRKLPTGGLGSGPEMKYSR